MPRLSRLRRPPRCLLLALLLLAARSTRARGQDTTATANLRPTAEEQLVVLTLRDGSTLIGRVLEVTPATVRFASALGESSVPRDAIRDVRITAASASHGGEFWPEDPSRTRLFFAPTGRTLRAREAYFSDAYVLFPSVQGGLTDRVTLGGGVSLIPFLSVDEQLFYLTPKVGVYASPTLNVSVGALVAGVGRALSTGPVGIVYTVSTFGGEESNVTAGLGFGFDRSSTSNAVLMLGGAQRVSRNIALVTENYLFSERGRTLAVSGGVRFIGEKIAVDLAGFTTSGLNGIPIPYVAFIYRF
jgi:hypothetical protein